MSVMENAVGPAPTQASKQGALDILKQLEELASMIQDATDSLESRLAPVINVEPTSPNKPSDSVPTPPTSELVHRLNHLGRRLDNVHSNLRRLYRDVEL
jgi:hypothetical protein